MSHHYLAVKCPYCGGVRAVKGDVKSFRCFQCGRRVRMRRSLILASSDDFHEISEIVRRLKLGKI